jgi:hypothetical protein
MDAARRGFLRGGFLTRPGRAEIDLQGRALGRLLHHGTGGG